jgi:hypothetical protein
MKQRICPHCKQYIEPDDPVETVGEAEYHMVCWEEEEELMENANLDEL